MLNTYDLKQFTYTSNKCKIGLYECETHIKKKQLESSFISKTTIQIHYIYLNYYI